MLLKGNYREESSTKRQHITMINYAVNMSPVGPKKSLLRGLREQVSLVATYPNHLNNGITKILSDFFRVSQQSIALGVGSTQILFDIPKLLTYKRAVIITPTFWEYSTFNAVFKKKIKKIKLDDKSDFVIDYEKIREEIRPGDCVFICNASNPTSSIYNKKRLVSIIKQHPNVQFVVDETYLIFRGDFFEQTLTKIAPRLSNLCVVMSFSKFFSVPGLRFGMMVSNQNIVDKYNEQFHIPYSINPLTEFVLRHLLVDTSYVSESWIFHDMERVRFYNALKASLSTKLHIIEPSANFIIARLIGGQTSNEVCHALEQKGFRVRGGHELLDVGEHWIRISVNTKKNNDRLIRVLNQVLLEKK